MTTPHEQQVDRADLLSERLNADELRTLLERLQTHEAAAAAMPTVGAVVEATGADPTLIARLLADIRGQIAAEAAQAQAARLETQRSRRCLVRKVVAWIVAAIAAFILAGLFTVRTTEVQSNAPTVQVSHADGTDVPQRSPKPAQPGVPAH